MARANPTRLRIPPDNSAGFLCCVPPSSTISSASATRFETSEELNFPSRRRNRGDGILKMFADETGGNAFFPDKMKELPKNFASIRQELRSQYTLAYRSTNDKKDGAYRKVIIAVDNNDYSVRARAGYYAATAIAGRPD